MEHFARSRGFSEEDRKAARNAFYTLANSSSEEDFKEKLDNMVRQKQGPWASVAFANYIKTHTAKELKEYSGKWKLEQLHMANIERGMTNNPAEGVNNALKSWIKVHDRWKPEKCPNTELYVVMQACKNYADIEWTRIAKAYYDRSDEYRLKSAFDKSFKLDPRTMPNFQVEGAHETIMKINKMLADNPEMPHTDPNDVLSFTEKKQLRQEMNKGLIAAAQDVYLTAVFDYVEEGKYYTCVQRDGQRFEMHLGDNYACPCPGEQFCKHILAARMKWGLATSWEVPETANLPKRMPIPKHPFNQRKIRPSSKKPKATDDFDPAIHTTNKPNKRTQRKQKTEDLPNYIEERLDDTIPSGDVTIHSVSSSDAEFWEPINKRTKNKFQQRTKDAIKKMTGYSNEEITEIHREETEKIKEIRKKRQNMRQF